MKIKYIILFWATLLPLVVSAQASGGQIRRNVTKTNTEVKKASKPHRSTSQTEQSAPTYAPPAIQPLPISSLSKFNIVAGTYSILANAQGFCQSLRDKGWGAQIYFDSSNNMYRVLMVGTNDEPEAVLYRKKAQESYPASWIMVVDNGQLYRYE